MHNYMIELPRAILLIDGNNWYHGLKKIGIQSTDLEYRKVAEKLLQHNRRLIEICYYVGKVFGDRMRVRRQKNFLKVLRLQGVKISLGRIEKHEIFPKDNPTARNLKNIINQHRDYIRADILAELTHLCAITIPTYTEKQVDVQIAVDLLSMAQRDEYDTAYLLSADGDFVPAVKEAKRVGKCVFAVSASTGRQLGSAVNDFIRLRHDWFLNCYL